jgi:hypothetical protein
MNSAEQTVQVTLRLPKEIYERVAHAAAKEQRQLEHVSDQYRARLAREGKLERSPDAVLRELRTLREQIARELYP